MESKRRSDGLRQRHGTHCARRGPCRCPWAFVVELTRGGTADRRQVTRSGFATLKEAKDARADVLRQDQLGLIPSDRKITTAAFLEQWWVWRTEQHEEPLRASTQVSYRLYLDRLIPLLGAVRLGDLRAVHIERAFASLKQQFPQQSPTSRQRAYATLRSAFRHAVRSKLIAVSPCDAVDLGFRAHRPRPTVWQPEEIGQFLDHLTRLAPGCPEWRLAPAYHLAAFSGLRRGEVAGLRWADVDLDRQFLTVTQQAVVISHRVEYSAPKTRAGEQRIVALDADTVAALRSWRAQQAAERLAWGQAWTDSGLVFTREDGRGWHPEVLTRSLPKLARAAGVPVIRFHDLRHLSASLQIAAGVSMAVVSKRLGHSTIGVTVDIYGHLLGDANQNAADASAALVKRHQRGGA